MTTKTKSESCRLIIFDEIRGERMEAILPESAEEALVNCLELIRATEWIDRFDLLTQALRDDEPIACSIRKTADQVVVRWHPTADLDAARCRMEEIDRGEVWI